MICWPIEHRLSVGWRVRDLKQSQRVTLRRLNIRGLLLNTLPPGEIAKIISPNLGACETVCHDSANFCHLMPNWWSDVSTISIMHQKSKWEQMLQASASKDNRLVFVCVHCICTHHIVCICFYKCICMCIQYHTDTIIHWPLCLRASQASIVSWRLKTWKPETIVKQAQSPAFLCFACKCSSVSDCCKRSMGWEEDSIWAWIFEYRTVILPVLMSVPVNISRCTLKNSLKNERLILWDAEMEAGSRPVKNEPNQPRWCEAT